MASGAPEPWHKLVQIQCCFTSIETTIRDGEPRTATSTFTQLLSSEQFCQILYSHRKIPSLVLGGHVGVLFSLDLVPLDLLFDQDGDISWRQVGSAPLCSHLIAVAVFNFTHPPALFALLLILSASSSSHQTLHCWFPCLLCLLNTK